MIKNINKCALHLKMERRKESFLKISVRKYQQVGYDRKEQKEEGKTLKY